MTIRNIISFISLIVQLSNLCAERRLPVETTSLALDGITGQQLWDFSVGGIISEDNRCMAANYGDSLLCEVLPDIQIWSVLRHDSIFYAGEENRNYLLSPVVPVLTSLGKEVVGVTGTEEFTCMGRIFSRLPVVERCQLITVVGNRGVIILPQGDTVRNVTVSIQTRKSTRWMNCSNIEITDDSLTHYRRTVVRWTLPGNRLPLAIQVMNARITPDGSTITEESRAFTIDRLEQEDLARMCGVHMQYSSDEIKNILNGIDVMYKGGSLIIGLSEDRLTQFIVDVLDTVGNRYLHQEFMDRCTLNVEGLPYGEYFAVLSVPGVTGVNVKYKISIR